MNLNLPPKAIIANEPFCDYNAISNEDYLLIINRLNEFADNTFTFGETIFKRIEEVGNINEKLKVSAEKIANKGAEISTSIFKRTRDSISQINQNSRVSQLKEKATDKLSSIGGRIWGVNFIYINNLCSFLGVEAIVNIHLKIMAKTRRQKKRVRFKAIIRHPQINKNLIISILWNNKNYLSNGMSL